MVSLSNGSTMMILTKNVSQCITSNLDDIYSINSCLVEAVPQVSEGVGQIIMNLTSPKTI